MSKIIEVQNVIKYFDQKRPVSLFKRENVRVCALNDVSFSLERGDFCAYAGPNGAGKSTTFRLLSGMLKAQSGYVRAFGVSPSEKRISIMKNTGVLFGNRNELWWDHPVRASFEWKRQVWDISADTYRDNLKLLTRLLGLDEIWNSFARELSMGQRMRANLALTLLHSPGLVLLDEPTLGMDVLAKRQMIEFLKTINREREVTILVTSHDMDDLKEMTSRIILINSGRLAFDGDYDKLMRATGDKHVVKFISRGAPPTLKGAMYVSSEGARHTYEYDAIITPPESIFAALSSITDISDVELSRAPIETVIAELYSEWQNGAAQMSKRDS